MNLFFLKFIKKFNENKNINKLIKKLPNIKDRGKMDNKKRYI